ncbi:MAG: histidine phosphatase family protein [Rubrivivax sp.]|nr:histidine phosphatase family protein [Rubrivivax sp.]
MDTRRRRLFVATPLLMLAARPALAQNADAGDPAALLRAGGSVALLRHALAPGTFDPPQFRLGDCSTQRNLNDEGRAQARRIGAWFAGRQLQPAAVRSSPWCRCVDTAQLAFGRADVLPALGSPHGRDDAARAAQRGELLAALRAVPRGQFEVWVTHDFVLSLLLGDRSASGGGLVATAEPGGEARVLARLAPA